MRGLKRLSNQKGSALVETVILLPIYILIFFGIIFLGESMVIKQKIHVAERYGAWMYGINQSPPTRDRVKTLFFSGFDGEVKLEPPDRYNIDFTKEKKGEILRDYPDGNLAGEVLNDFKESWMARYGATVEYIYHPPGYLQLERFGLDPVTIVSRHKGRKYVVDMKIGKRNAEKGEEIEKLIDKF